VPVGSALTELESADSFTSFSGKEDSRPLA
jgi:hypothetical protein